jgi:hypothetical protein
MIKLTTFSANDPELDDLETELDDWKDEFDDLVEQV